MFNKLSICFVLIIQIYARSIFKIKIQLYGTSSNISNGKEIMWIQIIDAVVSNSTRKRDYVVFNAATLEKSQDVMSKERSGVTCRSYVKRACNSIVNETSPECWTSLGQPRLANRKSPEGRDLRSVWHHDIHRLSHGDTSE